MKRPSSNSYDTQRRQWLRLQLRRAYGVSVIAGLGRLGLARSSLASVVAGFLTLTHKTATEQADGSKGLERLQQRVSWPAVRNMAGAPIEAPWTRGQATVLVFFHTTCPFCARHNVHLAKLAAQAQGRPLRILLAAQDKDPKVVARYLERKGYSFEVTMDEAPLHAALSMRKGVPLTCVIDRQGVLREVIPGEMFEEDVMELLKWAQA